MFRKAVHYLFWKLFRLLSFIPKRKYGMEFHENKPEPRGPFLVLANHNHYDDGFFVGYAVKTPIVFLSTDEVSTMTLIGSKFFRCILTEKGTPDFGAVKRMKKYLEQGISVGLFPEGDRTWDGESDSLNPNICRLVKLFNVPVRTVCLRGAHLSGPRWAETGRYGKISFELDTLYPEDYTALNHEQLYRLLTAKLYNNDVKNHMLENYTFKGKNLAKGIHNLLWLCPSCGGHDSLYGKKDVIFCSKCGSSWIIDTHGKYYPKNTVGEDLYDWCQWQKKSIKEWLDEKQKHDDGLPFTWSEKIHLFEFAGYRRKLRYGGRSYKSLMYGRLLCHYNEWVFIPYDKTAKKIHFNIEKVLYYVEGLNENFSFHYEGQRYRFDIPDRNSMKYLYFLRYRQEQNSPERTQEAK